MLLFGLLGNKGMNLLSRTLCLMIVLFWPWLKIKPNKRASLWPKHINHTAVLFYNKALSSILVSSRIINLHVDGAWKEGNSWCGLGFSTSLPDSSLVKKVATSAYSNSPLPTKTLVIKWSLKHYYTTTYIYLLIVLISSCRLQGRLTSTTMTSFCYTTSDRRFEN